MNDFDGLMGEMEEELLARGTDVFLLRFTRKQLRVIVDNVRSLEKQLKAMRSQMAKDSGMERTRE